MTAGDVFVIKNNDKHSLTMTQKFLFCNLAYMSQKLHISVSDLKKLSGFHALFVLEPLYRKSGEYNSFLHLSVEDLSFIKELVTSMQKEYHGNLPASLSMINDTSYNWLFKQTYNISPMGYLKRLRVNKACDKLKNTDLSMSEISSSVGILDSNYFSRLFKDTTGTNPRGYREQS